MTSRVTYDPRAAALPLEHAAIDPFYRALRAMRAPARPQLYGLAWPCRSFAQAVMDVFAARNKLGPNRS